MAKYTPAQAKSIKRYMLKMGEIRVRVSKEKKAEYQAKANEMGLSLNQMAIDAIEEKIKSMKME